MEPPWQGGEPAGHTCSNTCPLTAQVLSVPESTLLLQDHAQHRAVHLHTAVAFVVALEETELGFVHQQIDLPPRGPDYLGEQIPGDYWQGSTRQRVLVEVRQQQQTLASRFSQPLKSSPIRSASARMFRASICDRNRSESATTSCSPAASRLSSPSRQCRR